MKRFLILLSVFTGLTFAQNAPNCNQQNNIILATATAGASFNATSVKCVAWTFSYFSEGFSALTVQVEYAPDAGGTPGTWAVIPVGNLVSVGTAPLTLPLTNTVSNNLTINGYFPWMRVNLTAATGTGFINYTLVGNSYVGASSQVTSSASGSTSSTVNGPDASGSPATKAPVLTAGNDGTNVRTIKTDTSGNTMVVGSQATGATPTLNPVMMGVSRPTFGVGFVAANANGKIDIVSDNPVNFADNQGVNVLIPSQNFFNPLLIANSIFNEANWFRQRMAAAATMNVISKGAAQIEKGGRWSVFSNPAAGTVASATRAAGAAGVVHVVDCISLSAVTAGATAATNFKVQIRDGASGAGTVIWQFQIGGGVFANAGSYISGIHSFCGLNLQGTAATAMTIEFDAGLANLLEDVNMSGYDVN